MHRNQFTPGEIWHDTEGVPINAHGGGIIHHEGTYYWFGEHKIAGLIGNTAQVGISVYASSDLYNWKNEGIALSISDDPASEIFKGCIIERPKVVFDKQHSRFVMWFHLEYSMDYGAARSGVAVSDTPTGPFAYLHSTRPNQGAWPLNSDPTARRELSVDEKRALESYTFDGGYQEDFPMELIFRRDHLKGQMARDMTLFTDEDEQVYQIYSSEENGTLHISQLSDDCLNHIGKYIRIFPGGFHEAPTMLKISGKYYLITSGCTSWDPNAARCSVAHSIWGPWQELGNPCEGTPQEKETTFQSQGTFILAPEFGSRKAIFMADRWCPANPIDGRYVWLPLDLESDCVKMRWQSEWSH